MTELIIRKDTLFVKKEERTCGNGYTRNSMRVIELVKFNEFDAYRKVSSRSDCNHMSAQEIREAIQFIESQTTINLFEGKRNASFLKFMQEHLHETLLATDREYAYKYEISSLKEETERLKALCNEKTDEIYELKQRIELLQIDEYDDED